MGVVFESDRGFEWKRFKAFELSGWKKIVFAAYPLLGIFYVFYAIYTPSAVFWSVYAFFFMIYPVVLIYESTKPKVYEVVSTGVRVNGQLIRWRNFKEIVELEDMIGLKMHYGTVIALPKGFKDEILKHIGSERDSLITNQ